MEKMVPEKLILEGTQMQESDRKYMPEISKVIDYFNDDSDDEDDLNRSKHQN